MQALISAYFGTRTNLGNFFMVAAIIGTAIFGLFYAKCYKIKKWKALTFVVVMYAILLTWVRFIFWAETGFKHWGGNYFVELLVWAPLVAYPVAKLMKMDVKAAYDFTAPCLCLEQGIAHIGCIFNGCCRGYPSSWGIYNHITDSILFPIQIIESVTSLAITVFLVIYAKKHQFDANGKVYPIMLVLFGATRFIWEFFRDNYKLFFGLSKLALWALLAFVVGVIWLVVQHRKEANAIS